MHGYDEVSKLSIQFYNISIKYAKFLLLHDVRSGENSQNVKHFQVFYANIFSSNGKYRNILSQVIFRKISHSWNYLESDLMNNHKISINYY